MSTEVRLQHPFFTRVAIPVLRLIAHVLFFFLGPFRTVGRYRVPRSGGLLILANHLADVDPVAVQLACPREIYFMAKSELFEMKGLAQVIRWFRAFPVKRGEPDRDSIKLAVAYIQAGKAVCVFPEGELSQDGELQELKAGVALIARMAACPIICCRLDGTNRMMPYGKVIPRPAFGWVTATWGEVREFEKGAKADEVMGWAAGQLAPPES